MINKEAIKFIIQQSGWTVKEMIEAFGNIPRWGITIEDVRRNMEGLKNED